MTGRPVAALLAAAIVLSGCGGEPSAAAGKQTARQLRRSAALTYWQLYDSMGQDVNKGGAQGAFLPCGNPRGTTMEYVIEAVTGPRSHGLTTPQFLASFIAQLKKAGWPLKPAGDYDYRAIRNGVTVSVGRLSPGYILTAAKVLVTSRCADLGAAASTLSNDYSGNTGDRFDPGGPRVPTGFPTPGP